MIHALADVQSSSIGMHTKIWPLTVVLSGAKIGADCNICSHCFIENDVFIGDRVTIKNHVALWNGITLEDDVFIGPGVVFTNDDWPRSGNADFELRSTVVEAGASIGANSTILPGVKIGKGAMIGAGSVVTADVRPNSLYFGSPAGGVRVRDL